MNFKDTSEIKVPKKIINQIIGQKNVIKIIKKAAKQRRHVLLIGQSGTGKSMAGQGLAELLPKEQLVDILSFDNPNDDNTPLIKTYPQGEGKKLIQKAKIQSMSSLKSQNWMFFGLLILAMIAPWWIRSQYGDIMAAASMIGSMVFLGAFIIIMNLTRRTSMLGSQSRVPKILVDNSDKKQAPFLDASGAQVDALLGTVLHDPLQTFAPSTEIIMKVQNKNNIEQLKKIKLDKLLNPLFEKNKNNLIKKGKYEAFFTNKDELSILGNKNKNIEDVEVLSANRYPYSGNLIKITTESGKTLTVTPEHKIAVKKLRKIIYKEAQKLTKFDKIITAI